MHPLEFLASVSWGTGSLIVVAIFVIFAICGLMTIRLIFDHKILKAHNDVAGFIFANLGVLYSVLLGFTVVNVQQRFDKIKETTQIEASFLTDLYRDANVFSEKESIHTAIKEYTKSVIEDEWNSMSKGSKNERATIALHNLWQAYYAVTISDKKQEIWYSVSIGKLNQLINSRLTRLLGSMESLGAEMWTMLILGGVLLVAFMWFFGLENQRTHMVMVSTFAATMAFLLFLIWSLDTSFLGDVSIPPEAFEAALQTYDL